MKFGITFWPARPKVIVPLAKKADESGFESVWMGEHVVFPTRIDTTYPYRDVSAPLATTPLYDPIVTFAYIAAVTRRVKMGTSVYVLPLRHPLHVARMLVTLDAFSEGRFLFGVGVGWLREELEALGVEHARRGARTDEMITILQRLWTEPLFAHNGEFFQFPEIGFAPKPVNGSIPMLFGGESDLALRRAAKFGDGWIGVHMAPERVPAFVDKLRQLRAGTARAAQPLEITVPCLAIPTREIVERYAEVGVHRLLIEQHLFASPDRRIEGAAENIERFAAEVIAQQTG
jgi:probable F420-dependent oxidoreductase